MLLIEIVVGHTYRDKLTGRPVKVLDVETDDEGFPVLVTDAPDKPHGVCRNPFELEHLDDKE